MSTDELLMNYGRSSGELTDLKRRTSEHWSIVGVAGAFLDEDPAMEVLVLRGAAGAESTGAVTERRRRKKTMGKKSKN